MLRVQVLGNHLQVREGREESTEGVSIVGIQSSIERGHSSKSLKL